MCPNKNKPRNRVCPSGGSQNKKESFCDFVNIYRNDKGADVFVPSGISGGKRWITVYCYNGKGTHRIVSKNLPERKTFDEAQTDLNRYAKVKGWKCVNA
jgi:hypothetical protein